MPNYLRTQPCNQCGDCCGANGKHPTSIGWEAVRNWSLDDVAESFNLWTLFGLNFNPQTETVEPETNEGFHRVTGTPYYFTWQELRPGSGHLPVKDTSPAHDGSSFIVECPFLQDDPGDGSRPCALQGTQDEGARQRFCRPEEHPTDYVPEEDIWDERMVQQWQADHPNCSYVFVEIPG
jgi:hypothetical protein